MVSGTWLPRLSRALRWERSASLPRVSRSPSPRAVIAAGISSSDSARKARSRADSTGEWATTAFRPFQASSPQARTSPIVRASSPVVEFQAATISRVCSDAALYSSRAAPLFSARTPETPTTKLRSPGSATDSPSRIGQKRNRVSRSTWQHSMAVWSSEPPKVPTPRTPVSDPKPMPFSMQAR